MSEDQSYIINLPRSQITKNQLDHEEKIHMAIETFREM